ncbi:MAG: hypothetical protein U0166_18390 [Acidobacteriota bacterium]
MRKVVGAALAGAIAIATMGCQSEATKKLNEAHLAYGDHKFDEAIKLYGEAEKLNPANKEITSYIARATHDQYTAAIGTDKASETADAAIKAWEKVKETNPDEKSPAFMEAQSQINEIFQRMGKDEVGAEYYKKLIEKSPNSGNYLLLAEFLFKQLKYEEAIAAVDDGIAKYPEEKSLWLTKAIYLWSWGYKEKNSLPPDIKASLTSKGMEAVQKCITISGQPEGTPYSYRNLLYRQMAEQDPAKSAEYLELAKADVGKFKELWEGGEKAWRDELAGKAAAAAAPTPPPQ